VTEYVASWSGGKDSCFALWKAICQGVKVSGLLNFVNRNSTRVMSHSLDYKLIALQSQAIGLPILQRKVTWETYEAEFKSALRELKHRGITGLITGDIHLQEHKDWIDRVCNEVGVEAMLPLWGSNSPQLLNDFIEAGFKAIIVSVKTEIIGKDWLGKEIDKKFAVELGQLAIKSKIDICGEAGEFHTFVYDGPLFIRGIRFDKGATKAWGNYRYLEIKNYSLIDTSDDHSPVSVHCCHHPTCNKEHPVAPDRFHDVKGFHLEDNIEA